jgi:glutaredoxin 3
MDDTVKQLIAQHKAIIFSKTTCPYCDKAKRAFSACNVAPFILELDQRADGGAWQDALERITGARSVPRVFVGGTFIGGGDDTAAKAASGELKKLCTKAGL